MSVPSYRPEFTEPQALLLLTASAEDLLRFDLTSPPYTRTYQEQKAFCKRRAAIISDGRPCSADHFIMHLYEDEHAMDDVAARLEAWAEGDWATATADMEL